MVNAPSWGRSAVHAGIAGPFLVGPGGVELFQDNRRAPLQRIFQAAEPPGHEAGVRVGPVLHVAAHKQALHGHLAVLFAGQRVKPEARVPGGHGGGPGQGGPFTGGQRHAGKINRVGNKGLKHKARQLRHGQHTAQVQKAVQRRAGKESGHPRQRPGQGPGAPQKKPQGRQHKGELQPKKGGGTPKKRRGDRIAGLAETGGEKGSGGAHCRAAKRCDSQKTGSFFKQRHDQTPFQRI